MSALAAKADIGLDRTGGLKMTQSGLGQRPHPILTLYRHATV